MRIGDILELGWGNLSQARLRTLLTTLGVAIGVAALSGMVSLGVGLQDNLNAKLLKTGFFQTIAVFPQGEQRITGRTPRLLDDVSLVAIRQIPGVRRADPDVRLPLRIEAGDKNITTTAVGLAQEAAEETIFREMPHGKYFADEKAAEIILNTEAARDLGFAKPADLVGQTVKALISPRGPMRFGPQTAAMVPGGAPALAEEITLELRVIGLIARERAMFGNLGSRAYLPFAFAREKQEKLLTMFPMLAMFRQGFQGATVHLTSAKELDRVEKEITGMGFRTISIASAISQLRRVFLVVDLLLAFVGSIGLAVACLGITNTMVMAVLERTREIGVMKAVGAEDEDIRRLFLSESAVIGAAGGALGLTFAWILGRLINAGANFYFSQQGLPPENLFSIPLWLIAAAMAFAALVAVAAGLYPAARAARIDPTRALRHD